MISEVCYHADRSRISEMSGCRIDHAAQVRGGHGIGVCTVGMILIVEIELCGTGLIPGGRCCPA